MNHKRRTQLRHWVCIGALMFLAQSDVSVFAAQEDAMRLEKLDVAPPPVALENSSTLHDRLGHWVVLHFWATWCSPCIKELPALDQLSRRWKGEIDFVAIAIDDGNDKAVDDFVARSKITIPVVHRQDAHTTTSYWSWGVPVTYFVNPAGRIVARALGPRDWTLPQADSLLRQLTGATPTAGTSPAH